MCDRSTSAVTNSFAADTALVATGTLHSGLTNNRMSTNRAAIKSMCTLAVLKKGSAIPFKLARTFHQFKFEFT
jgi:hypothetical protein